MKILHTSDWHLGHLFHGQRRAAEFEALLDWMLETVERERIEALIVAGDLFD
ncbi:MAG: metallophosphoesterase, partial [Myxococcales bacterium]|nr:metallophosphoesterase [Myxococcales bacterium]